MRFKLCARPCVNVRHVHVCTPLHAGWQNPGPDRIRKGSPGDPGQVTVAKKRIPLVFGNWHLEAVILTRPSHQAIGQIKNLEMDDSA